MGLKQQNLHMCGQSRMIWCMEAQTRSMLAALSVADLTRTGANTHADQHFPTAPPATVTVCVIYNAGDNDTMCLQSQISRCRLQGGGVKR